LFVPFKGGENRYTTFPVNCLKKGEKKKKLPGGLHHQRKKKKKKKKKEGPAKIG